MVPVGAVVCVKRKGMKDSWCLVTSFTDATAQEVLDVYARRFTIEETFRDVKDLKFGMGLKQVRV
ncbi:transposase, partial [Corallococcus sp. RDP092CA]|uniref:transposase n=1 Tax=Corallococcus sp. RDP092CA TaxID=3109369 RepID=UPI0035B00806